MADAAAVAELPQLPIEDDDDADDLTFSKDFRAEDATTLTAKEADFRAFLCDSGAANEIVRLLVGLGESAEPPADPVAFLRAKFDSQDLPEMVNGKVRDDIPALLELNESLHARVAELSGELQETLSSIAAAEAAAAAPILQTLTEACASEATEGALDVAKLYAAVAAKFPAPPEVEEGAEPPPPPVWAAEGAASPEGTATPESLDAWAVAAFGYGSALAKEHGAELTLALLAAAAAPDEPCDLDEAKAAALYAACVLLVDYTEEVKPPPPEEAPEE